MTIYILDEDPKKIAESLDDKSLNFMIKDIAQTLCNVHYLQAIVTPLENNQRLSDLTKNIPLPLKNNMKGLSASYDEWSQWAKECVANYNYLWQLGISCDWELAYRNDFELSKKYHDALEWCRDNTPDLPKWIIDNTRSNVYDPRPFPLVMPKKFQTDNECQKYMNCPQDYGIYLYRSYYQEKLKKHFSKYHCTGLEMTWAWTKREKPQWINL